MLQLNATIVCKTFIGKTAKPYWEIKGEIHHVCESERLGINSFMFPFSSSSDTLAFFFTEKNITIREL